MRRTAASIAAAGLALAALPAHAISKCTDANGKVSYIEGACPANTRQQKLTVMPGPAPAPQAQPQAPGPGRAPASAVDRSKGLLSANQDVRDPRMDTLVTKLATYEGCQGASRDFQKNGGPASYQEWRAQNAQLLDRLPRSQRYMKVLVVERQRVQYRLARRETREAFLDTCRSLAPAPGSNKPR